MIVQGTKLKAKETLKLLEKYANTKDINIRNTIVLGNVKLIPYTLNKMSIYDGDTADELMSVGYLSLIKAVETFDISRGFAFSTYAVKLIKCECIRWLNMNINKHSHVMSYDIPPTVNHLNEEYGSCIDMIIGPDDTELSAWVNYINDVLYEVIDTIPKDRYKSMLKLYYGLDNMEPKSHDAIGILLNCTHQNVSRSIQYTVIPYLRKKLIENKINGGMYK